MAVGLWFSAGGDSAPLGAGVITRGCPWHRECGGCCSGPHAAPPQRAMGLPSGIRTARSRAGGRIDPGTRGGRGGPVRAGERLLTHRPRMAARPIWASWRPSFVAGRSLRHLRGERASAGAGTPSPPGPAPRTSLVPPGLAQGPVPELGLPDTPLVHRGLIIPPKRSVPVLPPRSLDCDLGASTVD